MANNVEKGVGTFDVLERIKPSKVLPAPVSHAVQCLERETLTGGWLVDCRRLAVGLLVAPICWYAFVCRATGSADHDPGRNRDWLLILAYGFPFLLVSTGTVCPLRDTHRLISPTQWTSDTERVSELHISGSDLWVITSGAW